MITAQTAITPLQAKTIASILECNKDSDVNSGYQMYSNAQWDHAIATAARATTLADIIAVLEVPDFYSKNFVIEHLAPMIDVRNTN